MTEAVTSNEAITALCGLLLAAWLHINHHRSRAPREIRP